MICLEHLKNVKVITIKEKDKDTYTSIIVSEEIFTCGDTMGVSRYIFSAMVWYQTCHCYSLTHTHSHSS